MNGKFVLSLDFELLWGVRDKRTIQSYGKNITNVKEIIPRTIHLFEKYGISATFSTVGFLFAETKSELLGYIPDKKPSYEDKNLSPYNGHFDQVKESYSDDPYHFAPELIRSILNAKGQYVGTHTFSHYYCIVPGQNLEEFHEDLKAAVQIAEKYNCKLESIVFPRNQCNADYLSVCSSVGIKSYRGNEPFWANAVDLFTNNRFLLILQRIVRLMDSYVKISGHNTFNLKDLTKIENHKDKIQNIPASRFLRPYSKKASILEKLKIRRIKRSMTHAAKNKELYHLWWHPHNFGSNMEENFAGLEEILKHYEKLSRKYNFESASMESLTEELSQNMA